MSAFSSIPLGSYDVRPQKGFTSSLLATLNASRAKVENWVQHEKTKADKIVKEYRNQFSREQAQIDSKVTTLLALQLERGLAVSNDREDNDNSESIAMRKTALEEQRSSLESELEKLREEYASREKRVRGNQSAISIHRWHRSTLISSPFLFVFVVLFRNHYRRKRAKGARLTGKSIENKSGRSEEDYSRRPYKGCR